MIGNLGTHGGDDVSRQFQIADVAKAIGVQPSELSGVWGSLTRRLKTVTGDSDAYLIDWTKSALVVDDNDNYVDHIGEVTELTIVPFAKRSVVHNHHGA